MKIIINTESGTPAQTLFEAIAFVQETVQANYCPEDIVATADWSNATITVLPNGTFIMEESDRGVPIYCLVTKNPDGSWGAIECDAEGEPIVHDTPPSPFQAIGMLFVVVDACECHPDLKKMVAWDVPGWHHQIGCPLRPAGTYQPVH